MGTRFLRARSSSRFQARRNFRCNFRNVWNVGRMALMKEFNDGQRQWKQWTDLVANIMKTREASATVAAESVAGTLQKMQIGWMDGTQTFTAHVVQ